MDNGDPAEPGEFLSTLPARGATYRRRAAHRYSLISIHAPREGSDGARAASWKRNTTFLSTLPARGATRCLGRVPLRPGISIHAPREGSDDNPALRWAVNNTFLSTLPARGATIPC